MLRRRQFPVCSPTFTSGSTRDLPLCPQLQDVDCPECGTDEHVALVGRLTGSQGKLRRLAQWSNDLLIEIAGDGFKDLQHALDFIWWSIGGQLRLVKA